MLRVSQALADGYSSTYMRIFAKSRHRTSKERSVACDAEVAGRAAQTSAHDLNARVHRRN